MASNITGLKARISTWAKGIGLKGNRSKMEGYIRYNIDGSDIIICYSVAVKEHHLAGVLLTMYILRE